MGDAELQKALGAALRKVPDLERFEQQRAARPAPSSPTLSPPHSLLLLLCRCPTSSGCSRGSTRFSTLSAANSATHYENIGKARLNEFIKARGLEGLGRRRSTKWLRRWRRSPTRRPGSRRC